MNIKLKKVLNAGFPLLVAILIVFIWWLLSLAVNETLIIPSPAETFIEAFRLLGQAIFWRAYGGTLLRSLIAVSVSFAVALGFAILTELKPVFKKALLPMMGILRSTPTMAFILIVIIWAKGMWTPVIAGGIILIPTLYSGFSSAIAADPQLVEMARAFNVPKSRQIKKMYLPKIIPEMTESLAGGVSLAIKLIVSGEVLSQSAYSLGGLMQQASSYLETPTLFALTLTAVVTGLAFEYAIRGFVRAAITVSRNKRRKRIGEML